MFQCLREICVNLCFPCNPCSNGFRVIARRDDEATVLCVSASLRLIYFFTAEAQRRRGVSDFLFLVSGLTRNL